MTLRLCGKKPQTGDLLLLLGFLYTFHIKNRASTRLVRRGGGEGVLKMTDARCRRAQCFTTGTDTPFMCVCKIDGWP